MILEPRETLEEANTDGNGVNTKLMEMYSCRLKINQV